MYGNRLRTAAILPLLAGLATLACERTGTDRVLAIEATGTLAGIAYIDADGDENPGSTDTPVAGLRIGLLVPGTRDTTATATTGENGVILLPEIPVGHYDVVLDPATVPDTLELLRIDSAAVTVAANDTVLIVVVLGRDAAADAETAAAPTVRTQNVAPRQHRGARATTTVAPLRQALSPEFAPTREIPGMPALARIMHLRYRPHRKPMAVRLRSAGLQPTRA